ncbi:MAG: hypothetical protein VW708_08585, partial [Ilumatobacter sp.]
DEEFEDDSDDDSDADESDDDDDEDEEESSRRRGSKDDDSDDEDDEMLSPDDVEADLDMILKDRMVAADEEGEGDEDEEPAPVVDDKAEAIDGIQPKRSDEQLCSSCFLLVRANAPSCPVGDDDCPVFS